MGTRSIAEVTDIAKRWQNDERLPAHVRDLAVTVLRIVRDIEQNVASHPAVFKTLDDVVECLIEETVRYTADSREPE